VQGALAVGKFFDAPSVGNMSKQHQSHSDYETLFPGHIAAHTSQELSLNSKGNFI
jgi:hypothetical protein